jgi:predicted PhzF superfamily epimerase YddE/YHI9
MEARIFQLDAFTSRRFQGNPAAVVLLESYPPDPVLQVIAAENNLAETAFLVPRDHDFSLRWFTPKVEVPLCGHATLASAAVVMERLEPDRRSVVFHSPSGALPVERSASGYVLDFPARRLKPIRMPSVGAALRVIPSEVLVDDHNYLAVLQSADAVRAVEPDSSAIELLDRSGVIVSGPGDEPYDFTSRYFAPAKGIPEDPVTGGAHCTLAPYWAERRGKTRLRALQASARGGELTCPVLGERVMLEGSCVFYLEGTIQIGDDLASS